MWSTGFEFQVEISCDMGVHQRVVLFGTVLDPDDKEKEMNKFLESNADFSMEDHISKFHFQDKSVNETMIQLLN